MIDVWSSEDDFGLCLELEAEILEQEDEMGAVQVVIRYSLTSVFLVIMEGIVSQSQPL
jgi:hypothetical protein